MSKPNLYGRRPGGKKGKAFLKLLFAFALAAAFSWAFQIYYPGLRTKISHASVGDSEMTWKSLRNPYQAYLNRYPSWLQWNELSNADLSAYIARNRAHIVSGEYNAPIGVACFKRVPEIRFAQAAEAEQIAILDCAKAFLQHSCSIDPGACGDWALFELLDPRQSDLILAISVAKKGIKDPHSQDIFNRLNGGRGKMLLTALEAIDKGTYFANSKLLDMKDLAKENADRLRALKMGQPN